MAAESAASGYFASSMRQPGELSFFQLCSVGGLAIIIHMKRTLLAKFGYTSERKVDFF
jgi:hypothetical protein